MYDDVLLPVAFDDAEENPAVDRAIDLATTYDATLHVISAVDTALFDPFTPRTEEVQETLEGTAEETVERAAEQAESADIDVETRLGHGAPHQVITDYVADRDIDLVVMATHGREGLEHTLLGSVTEKVVRSSEAPVLTVPNP